MRVRKFSLLVVGLLLLAGCSEPVSHAYTTQAHPTRPTATTVTTSAPVDAGQTLAAAAAPAAADEPIAFTGAGFDLHTAGKVPAAAFNAAWAGVLDTLNRYLEVAVLTPLRSGGPAGDLAPLFTPLSVARVLGEGPDRAAFVDEGLGATTDLRKDAAVATLTALAGSDGIMSVVVAVLDLKLSGLSGGAPMSLERAGEVVLMPDGGAWRIDAWDLKVTRRLAETTTTAIATTGGRP